MKAKRIMLQGTSSDVGKSTIGTALCRIFTQDGYNVSPFKAQNNAEDPILSKAGEWVGRTQVIQAAACKKEISSQMNPFLLIPLEFNMRDLILNGQSKGIIALDGLLDHRDEILQTIKTAYLQTEEENDIVLLEGTGSPADAPLKRTDFANMNIAEQSDSEIILIASIDKGGALGSLYGTIELLDKKQRSRIKGMIINKYKDNLYQLDVGIKDLEKRTGIPVIGVIPYFKTVIDDFNLLTDYEDIVLSPPDADLEIVIPKLPNMTNIIDVLPLLLEPRIRFRFVELWENIGTPDLIVLPDSQSPMLSAKALLEKEMFWQIIQAQEHGSFVFGIGSGMQILGKTLKNIVSKPGEPDEEIGIGLLNIRTELGHKLQTGNIRSRDTLFGQNISGYRLCQGKSFPTADYAGDAFATLESSSASEGFISTNKRVFGTEMHGIFDNGAYTRSLLNHIRNIRRSVSYEGPLCDYAAHKQAQYDQLAELARKHIDIQKLYEIMGF